MAKEPAPPPPVEVVPSVENGLSAIASGNAPVIFFDTVSNFGTYNGTAHMTLLFMRFLPAPTGNAGHDQAVAAHLRMNLAGLASLKDAISGIEGLLRDQEAREKPALN